VRTLSICIVTYLPAPAVLSATLASLETALLRLQAERGYTTTLWIVDNSPLRSLPAMPLRIAGQVHTLHGQGNIGFGRGHNLCLDQEDGVGELHLILNPDVELDEDALVAAVGFMDNHPDCVLLSPDARADDGTRQHLCKRYPSVLDLALRGFAPAWLRRLFDKRLASYEMREQDPATVCWAAPIVSGCFMMLRGDAFRRLGGFDPQFFLYFEDFDLSLRAATLGRIAAVPSVRIVHHGGHAARKGWKHVVMFARSGAQFFNKHGWRLS
jgi:GT2 family glycosyltransferase